MPLLTTKKITMRKFDHTPIADWLEANDFRNNRLWKLINGEIKTVENGIEISDSQFSESHPVPTPLNFYGGKPNADTTSQYLY